MENNTSLIDEIIAVVKEKQNKVKNEENAMPWEKSFVRPKHKVYANVTLDDINVKGTLEYLNFYSNTDDQNDSLLMITITFYITENNIAYAIEYNRKIDDPFINVIIARNYGDEETTYDRVRETELPETFLKDILEAIK